MLNLVISSGPERTPTGDQTGSLSFAFTVLVSTVYFITYVDGSGEAVASYVFHIFIMMKYIDT